MKFTFSFNPQSKTVQKIDWGMSKEISPEKIKQIESVEELEFKQISERAMDDLTGPPIETMAMNGSYVATY